MDPFLGEVRIFAGNFAPQNWALCQGQILSIAQNSALFSLLGVNFGGNGTSTFGLPDFRGRAPVHQGAGPGLTPRSVGEAGGETGVSLTGAQLPFHTHPFQAAAGPATGTNPAGNLLAQSGRTPVYAAAGVPTQPMAAAAIGPAGNGVPHNNMQPFLALNFIICLAGIYPARG